MQKVIASGYFREGSDTLHRQASRTTCTQEIPGTRAVTFARAEYTGRWYEHDHHQGERAHKTGGTP
jgi:hypothetical protein